MKKLLKYVIIVNIVIAIMVLGIKLYQNNVSNKIIMSGDHGKKEYD